MIKKAIIPIAGLGTRFLPLSRVVPKELWPLVDKPVIQYIMEEARASGIEEIIFVVSPEKKFVFNYFKKSRKLERIVKEKKRNYLLPEIKDLHDLFQNISFSYVLQRKPLGDGQAVFLAKNKIGKEPFAVLFADDVVDSKIPCLSQLMKVFKVCQRPVIALSRIPKEKLPSYGVVAVEKITNRLYKIKEIIEKPSVEKAPSDLAIMGKYILTPEVFDYLKRIPHSSKGEILLANALAEMVKDGKIVYGYEIEGKWLECGNKLEWLKSHLYLSLKHPEIGPKIKEYLKELT